MYKNPLKQLESLGQSIWLDYIRRDLIVSGELHNLIENDGLRGMTSNPAIFEKAISESNLYTNDIRTLSYSGKDVREIYEEISQADIKMAADTFKPVFEKTNGKDGYVSLEVNPHFARNTEATLEEARRLWKALNRPNVFIKVPATKEGLPAIKQLISEGININVTLIFGLPRYREVFDAYLSGLELRVARNEPVDTVTSVASFFLSRIDVLADPILEAFAKNGSNKADLAKWMQGQVAIASAKVAYQMYKKALTSSRFKELQKHGARMQRLLWASTSTKNPEYNDLKYVEPLIGTDTVNTVPPETLNAYRDHGKPAALTIEDHLEQAYQVMHNLQELGIDIDKLTQHLEDEGIEKFDKPFDKLMDTLSKASMHYTV